MNDEAKPTAHTAAEVGRDLQQILSSLVQQRGVNNAVLRVESGDGSFLWSNAAGESAPGREPMTPETPYFIASITKLYTASLVLLLAEDGKITLDSPISDYLPAGYAEGIHVRAGTDESDRITVRNLLIHSSGLPNYLEDSLRGQPSLSARVFADGDREFTDAEALAMVRSLEAHFEPQPRAAARVRYSDTNYWLLGLIIEHVSGLPLEQAYETLILRPLALQHTYLFGRSEPAAPTPELAGLWVNDRPLELPRFMRSHAADGGLVATAADTIAFLRALTTGRLFSGAGTYGSMLEHTVKFGFPTDPAAARAPGWPIEAGLGIFRLQLPRLVTGLRRLPAVVGHTGSTGSWLFYCPDWDVYLAGTVNQATAGQLRYRFLPRMLRAVQPLGNS